LVLPLDKFCLRDLFLLLILSTLLSSLLPSSNTPSSCLLTSSLLGLLSTRYWGTRGQSTQRSSTTTTWSSRALMIRPSRYENSHSSVSFQLTSLFVGVGLAIHPLACHYHPLLCRGEQVSLFSFHSLPAFELVVRSADSLSRPRHLSWPSRWTTSTRVSATCRAIAPTT
jgi:hypothetical protein